MSYLLLSSTRHVSSSPDLADGDDDPTQQPPSSARHDSVDQLDQFLREALEKPRERLSSINSKPCPSFSAARLLRIMSSC
ncbi:hypothetical protein E2562_016553 [Oryza meyeriana var. granulata]|uniref:Uncharacterized protein n=1 Tax=Oryza meyeriana var. granulata TaxID=110450 RepID=A0A6G1C6M0_9ORYZ|nr:hypothetical protein E2562_016553 [Oryza meyeriana var. granulata]